MACALVRPSRSLADLEVPSVKKKLKDKAFARGVSREDVMLGADELGVPLEELIAILIAALRPHERPLGLGARLSRATPGTAGPPVREPGPRSTFEEAGA